MKSIYISKKWMPILVIVIIVFLIFGLGTTIPAFSSESSQANKPIYSVDTDKKMVALTFDTSWSEDSTKKILDILETRKVKATFFLVGFWVEQNPDLVRDISRRGFEIGNHSSTHPHMSKLTSEQIKLEVSTSNEKIEEITGKQPRFFRPPFGDYNDNLINTINEMEMQSIEWSIDSLDWKEKSADSVIDRVMEDVQNGSIILFQTNSKYITKILPRLIDKLKDEDYQLVSVSKLVKKSNYYVDNAGIQHGN